LTEVFATTKTGGINIRDIPAGLDPTPHNTIFIRAGRIWSPYRRTAPVFGGEAAGGDALEGVPQRRIAAAALVDRKVALKHRAVSAEVPKAAMQVSI